MLFSTNQLNFSMGNKPMVAILVVNWNCGQLSAAAVSPYLALPIDAPVRCRVIIVDNASTDDSLQFLSQLPVVLIQNQHNRGFGHACNQAREKAQDADYLLLLNPDTESNPEVLFQLVAYLEHHQQYAVAGPQQINQQHTIIRSCGRFPNTLTAFWEVLSFSKLVPGLFMPAPIMIDWDHQTDRDVDHIMGSYMLIRQAAIPDSGFMDPDYFVYWEDIDLSRRMANQGYKSRYLVSCQILHEGGASGDVASAQRLYYSISARRTYWRKHLNFGSLLFLTLISITAEPVLRIIQVFLKRQFHSINPILQAYSKYYREVFTGKRAI